MSSRAVRKQIGHTTEDDLAQLLQKVGVSKNEDDKSDDETDLIVSNVNSHRRNVFEMLANEDDDHDEKSKFDSDIQQNDDTQEQQSTSSKTKRKRKAKKKNNQISTINQVFLLRNEFELLKIWICLE